MQKLESPLYLSRQFVLLHLIVLLGSLGVICYSSLPWLVKLILLVLSVLYSGFILYQQQQWQFIQLDENGWQLQRGKERYAIDIAGESTVTSFVTVLRFRVPGNRFKQSCVIFKDTMEPEVYRRMVVCLRFF